MSWRSSAAVPSGVADALPLNGKERLLAGARDSGGRWHAGSDAALYLAVEAGYDRTAWESLEGAHWDRDSNRLTVVEVADFGMTQPRHVLELEQAGRFVELVRERITASVLATRPVPVAGRRERSVTVVARRSPTRTGEIGFSFLLDRGLDPSDPNVREAFRTGLAQVRDELGL